MRFATYNVWNSRDGMPNRTEQVVEQIKQINADVFCLQEVKNEEYHTGFVSYTGYPYHCFYSHDNEEEGLSILSRFPLYAERYVSSSLIAALDTGNCLIALANVHLPWESVLSRERKIVDVEKGVSQMKADYRLILGDFNCSQNSSVQQYLLGQASLNGTEANPCWYDLAESVAAKTDSTPEITLDFHNNPRWHGENTIEVNQRFDRILMQNTYPNNPPRIMMCKVFGKTISEKTGFAASDHYGIYIDLMI